MEVFLWDNGIRGNRINTSNLVSNYNTLTTKWDCSVELIEPAGLPNVFNIEAEATLINPCVSTPFVRQFTNLKNAKFSLPTIIKPNIVLTSEGGNNTNLFSVPTSSNYNTVSWKFFDAVKNLEYPTSNYSITNNSAGGESVNVVFNDLVTIKSLQLYVKAIFQGTCGTYEKSTTAFYLIDPNTSLESPILQVQNARPLNQYCTTGLLTLLATANNAATESYFWEIKSSNASFAAAESSTANLLTTAALRNTVSNTRTIDIGALPYSNWRYLVVRVRNKFSTSNASGQFMSEYSSYTQIERIFTPTTITGTITYIDPVFGRIKNTKLCNGNHAYFYTNATSTNNSWVWKIDGNIVATTIEPKLKLPVNYATHNGKVVTLQPTDANGCPSSNLISAEAITMHDAQAPVLAYDRVAYNVRITYLPIPTRPGGGSLVNGYATVLYVKNTNSAITTPIDAWKWYEQNNSAPGRLTCEVNGGGISAVQEPQPYGFPNVYQTRDNSIREQQGGFYPPYPANTPNCKYFVTALKETIDRFIINNKFYCWSDPYILYTDVTGSGPYRKELLDETQNAKSEIVLDAQVYPNPSEGKITIKIPTNSGEMIVTDTQGKQVGSYTLTQSNTTLDMAEFPIGLYHLHITTPIKTYMLKLMLTK